MSKVGGGTSSRVEDGEVYHGRDGVAVAERLESGVPQVYGMDYGFVPVYVLVTNRREKLVEVVHKGVVDERSGKHIIF